MKEKLQKIKQLIKNNIGTRCNITARSGRKKLYFENCVIESAYPEIFVVKYTEPRTKLKKCMSFSYTDLFIKKVSIIPQRKNENEKGA